MTATIRGQYRYRLGRQWLDGDGTVAFVMLNPSRADHRKNDNTIARCIGWAQDWGFHRLEVVNLFAYRSPSPKALLEVDDPVGPENDAHLVDVATNADRVVCAWGSHPIARARGRAVAELLRGVKLECLMLTADGSPHHPRGLRTTLKPRPFPGFTNPV